MAVDYQDIGLTRSRIATLQTWVSFFKENESIFAKGLTIEELEAALTKLKGIGPWTVNYIGMRGLSDPDAFPSADLGIIKALTIDDVKPKNKDILALAETWRPWRAYAAIYLWQSLQLTTENNIKTDIKE
jgi:AraC family transcriptional regulator of adaptative response / DNA-3-methyladenine glycosylase II